jgi:hypothetical protein
MEMSKRERIILGVMGAAILVSLAYLLWPAAAPPSPEMTPEKLADSKKAGEAQLSALERIQLSAREIHAVTGGQQPWPRDPLGPKPPEPEVAVDRDKFRYSGFVRVGARSLAVINGREYQAGEQLESGGFEVLEITPEAVVLQGGPHNGTVRIPYQDPSFFTGR